MYIARSMINSVLVAPKTSVRRSTAEIPSEGLHHGVQANEMQSTTASAGSIVNTEVSGDRTVEK